MWKSDNKLRTIYLICLSHLSHLVYLIYLICLSHLTMLSILFVLSILSIIYYLGLSYQCLSYLFYLSISSVYLRSYNFLIRLTRSQDSFNQCSLSINSYPTNWNSYSTTCTHTKCTEHFHPCDLGFWHLKDNWKCSGLAKVQIV